MEKPPHQEYRDNLAQTLKDKRNSNPKKPEVGKANAQGFLEAKKEDSDEYKENRRIHLEDIQVSHNKTDESKGLENQEDKNRRTLGSLRLEYSDLDKYLSSSAKIYKILHIPLENSYFDYEKNEFVIEMDVHQDFQAHDGCMHGGVESFLMDIGGGIASFIEALKLGKNVITREMVREANDIKYRLPIKIGDKIKVVGKIKGIDGDNFTATTVIYLKKGEKELPAVRGVVEMKLI